MSILGSLFSVFGGNSADTDRGKTLEAYGDLSNVFNYALPKAKQGVSEGQFTQGAGLGELGDAGSYYAKLLHGDRNATLEAVAPVATAAGEQADAQKRQLADFGTSRGGGVNAAGQQIDTNRMSTVDKAIAMLKPGAAEGEARVGTATANIGSAQVQEALRLLGIGSETAGTLGSLSANSRATSQALHDKKAGQAADIAGGLLDVLFA